MPKRKALFLLANAAVDEIRNEQFMGVDHLVVPIVALVEGVVTPGNSGVPELALANEFARFPAGWDGRPVFLNHPNVNGNSVPANSPSVLEAKSFGLLFNTKVDGDKLKTEAWINLERVEELGQDIKDAVARLQSGDVTEVSTGLFADIEQKRGTFKGERFNSIWRGVVPDHLAILPEGTEGACSVADGCGAPRINQAAHEKGECDCLHLESESPFIDLWNKIKNFAVLKSDKKKMSDTSKRAAVKSALDETNSDRFIDVVDLVDNSVIYSSDFGDTLLQQSFSISEKGTVSLRGDPVKVRPEITFIPVQTATKELGSMTNEERVEALITNERTRFTPDNRDWLLRLDEAHLTQLEPIELQSSGPSVEEQRLAAVAEATAAEVKAKAETEAAVSGGNEEPITLDAHLESVPPEIRAVLQEGINMRQEKITALVTCLKDNSKCDFNESELKGMSLETLERIAKLASVPVRVLQGGSSALINSSKADDTGAPPPKKVFEGK